MADRVTLTDVVAAVVARLTGTFDDPAIAVWDAPPATANQLPAVWPEVLAGSGSPRRDRPATLRVVWVPVARANAAMWADLVAAVDALNAAFDVALPSGILITGRSWVFDSVDVGTVTRDALLYDLAVTYPDC